MEMLRIPDDFPKREVWLGLLAFSVGRVEEQYGFHKSGIYLQAIGIMAVFYYTMMWMFPILRPGAQPPAPPVLTFGDPAARARLVTDTQPEPAHRDR
jgi:hypothetical protein